jgi:hypothetical protein
MAVLLYVLVFNFISCDDSTTESRLGLISVLVVDNDSIATPVPNVEITVTPIDIIKMTDSNGTCNFEVKPGNYFVDAEVCCQGAGNFEYHVMVNVVENKTFNVKLLACLNCD